MGISGLWDVLGEGEIVHIADFAAAHFRQHHRPLRIAVDEACWRYNNLNEEQTRKIQSDEPAAHPVEKTILWRVLRLLRLNIQLLFVWDGLRKPGKSRWGGRGGGKIDHALVKDLHRMFDRLAIPYHQAPGEAEAECVLLERCGIVDAVWSEDGDCFMFGCRTLIKSHRERVGNSNKLVLIKDQIRVYRADTIERTLHFNADSFLLFALLTGGDYESKGLHGCGQVTAKQLSRMETGLGHALRIAAPRDVPAWRVSLQAALVAAGKCVDVPFTFPMWKVLEGYRQPAVSTHEQAHNLRGLRGAGWERPIALPQLRTELRGMYNFQTRELLKHITPILLARALARTTSAEHREANTKLGIELKATRRRKLAKATQDQSTDNADNGVIEPSERKILFSPAALLPGMDVYSMPADEDWTKFEKRGEAYDPSEKIEVEILDCLLQHGLPAEYLQQRTTTPSSKRQKTAVNGDQISASCSSAGSRMPRQTAGESSADRTGHLQDQDTAWSSPSTPVGSFTASTSAITVSVPKRRGRPPGKPTAKDSTQASKSTAKAKSDDPLLANKPRPPAQFRRLQLPVFQSRPPSGATIDLCDDSAEVETRSRIDKARLPQPPELLPLQNVPAPHRASHISRPPNERSLPTLKDGSDLASADHEQLMTMKDVRPGDVVPATALRELRARSAYMQTNGGHNSETPTKARHNPGTAFGTAHEIIDLT